MKVLIVGGGGREHAIAWKLVQSPRVRELVIAPGNAGTAALGRNVSVRATDIETQVALAVAEKPDLVVVAPDDPLALGLVDRLRAAGIRAWGPSAAAARIEASKAFAKQVMQRAAIPTARFAVFDDLDTAERWVRAENAPFVVKADGLALGKGVIVAEDVDATIRALRTIMRDNAFGIAGQQVLVEERLVGEEISLLAFADGQTIVPMLGSQDHKRLLADDRGPNTGGMGAYAPVPGVDADALRQLTATILQPAIDAMHDLGAPFVGVLYAGLMLTADGPRVLEFNARFGDPETQVLLPLLASDLMDIFEASIDGALQPAQVRWHDTAALGVVLAADGYPEAPRRGDALAIPATLPADAIVFHAGTALTEHGIVTAGGRVVTAVGLGATLEAAHQRAYDLAERVQFAGRQFRSDIGWRAFGRGSA